MRKHTSDEIDEAILQHYGKKSDLEQAVEQGLRGTPELGLEEKRQYLGVFRERVIKILTASQLFDNKKLNDDFVQAMGHTLARYLVVRSDAIRSVGSYLRIAREQGLRYKTVSRADLKGDIVLLVGSNEAVNVDNIRCRS